MELLTSPRADDLSALLEAFRRSFGLAPGEYRRQQLAAHGVRATAADAAPHRVDSLLLPAAG